MPLNLYTAVGAIAGGVTSALIGVILTIINVVVIIFALSVVRRRKSSGKCVLNIIGTAGALLISQLYTMQSYTL